MSVLINCKDIYLEYPGVKLLNGVTLGINEGDRIGIVGLNGSGKSSLLKVLAAQTQASSGEVTLRGSTTVGLLAQEDMLVNTNTVIKAIIGARAEHEWAADRRTREIINALIGGIDPNTLVGTLSGGQRRRVDLARLLIGSWDVLMLDEPTNHLDMQTISWLAGHLQTRWANGKGALLVITHDRWFLDEAATSMWEVIDGDVRAFEGGYSAYIQQRVEREAAEKRAEQRRQNIARKELAWLSRGAQARSTKPKFRVQAARDLIADVPPLRNELELKRMAMQRLGKQVVDLVGVSKNYAENIGVAEKEGPEFAMSVENEVIKQTLPIHHPAAKSTDFASREVIKRLDWVIGPGERIGILGANGEGKSTLLGLIDGSIDPSKGRVKIGASVRFGHLTQRLTELAPYENETVYKTIEQCKGFYRVDGKELSPSRLLERLGFAREQLRTRVSDLSGGQRRRLQLLITLLEEPNVLILDEPGNDLDTDMLAVVEDLLDNWPGTLLLVSHDRYLIERVTDNQYALIDGELHHMPGGIDQYLELLSSPRALSSTKPASPSNAQRHQNTPVLSRLGVSQALDTPEKPAASAYQVRKQMASLERKMNTLQDKIDKLHEQMHKTDPSDYEVLIRLGEEDKALKQQLYELEEEWLLLN